MLLNLINLLLKLIPKDHKKEIKKSWIVKEKVIIYDGHGNISVRTN